jgi:hypothetical protein
MYADFRLVFYHMWFSHFPFLKTYLVLTEIVLTCMTFFLIAHHVVFDRSFYRFFLQTSHVLLKK